MDRMINRLEAENYTMSIINGARRLDKRLLDMPSLREVFINAIAHNDWSIIEPAIYVFSDRIEIISHGGLPKGQTKEMFFKGVSTPRNKELMRILRDLDYVEQTGHGIPDVVKLYGKEVFEITDQYINAVLPFDKEVVSSNNNQNATVNVTVKFNDTEKIILSIIQENPKITLNEIAETLEKHRSTVARNLKSLKEKGVLIRHGSDKMGYWEIKE